MAWQHLTISARPAEYSAQVEDLLDGWRKRDPEAVRIFRSCFPGFLDQQVTWLEKNLSESEMEAAPIGPDEARLTLARWYSFRDWAALHAWVAEVGCPGSAIAAFERAVEAVVGGEAEVLRQLLAERPELVRARSTRVTCHDPAVHGATLLHYVGANGVEAYRQRTPANAVEIAKILLEAGAETDALAGMYGGECATLPMLVSSSWPAAAGLQVALAEMLLDYGAVVEGTGKGAWVSPLMTALVFGYVETARALVRRGALVSTLAAAAGLGLVADVAARLPGASAADRHRALALAAQLGEVEVVRLLVEAGEALNRFNPEGFHAHGTPLHQAAVAGHLAVVRLLVEAGARRDIQDKLWRATPLGWAEYGGQAAVAAYLGCGSNCD